MDAKQFDEIVEDTISQTRNVLITKNAGYSPGADKLSNFKKSAALQRCTRRRALGGYMTKHIISVYDMIEDDEPHSMDIWDEKLGDAINYLILLRAVVIEEHGELSKAHTENQKDDTA